MMPAHLINFINTARNTQREVQQHWRSVYSGEGSLAALPSIRRAKIQAIYKALRHNHAFRGNWNRLLSVVGFDSPLISVQPVMRSRGLCHGNTYLDALLWCAVRFRDWIRTPEMWHAETDDPHALFTSLIAHLFLNYPLPEFLISAWFEGYKESAWEHQAWALHLGRGGSLQQLSLPLALTHRAAHLFLQTPAHITIANGLRYAQVLAMGGTPELAAELMHALYSPEDDEAFFAPLIALLVRQQPADLDSVGTLIEYLRFEKTRANAMCESFDLQGRTTASLCRDAAEWQGCKNKGNLSAMWRKQELPPVEREVEFADGITAKWTLEELATGTELFEEGKQMRNCVYTYLENCLKGQSSIWSLRYHRSDYNKPRRVMTVEIEPAKRSIVQIGVFANRALKLNSNGRHTFALSLLKEWAETHELKLDCELE